MRRFATAAALALLTVFQVVNASAAPILVDGEELVYTISYNASWWPRTDVGTVSFVVSETDWEGKPAYSISASAATNSFFSVFFKMRDKYVTYLDRRTLLPYFHQCDKQEAGYRFSYKIGFNWNTMKAESWYKNLSKTEDHNITMDIDRNCLDGLGYLYSIRAQDFTSWTPGEQKNIRIVIEDKVQPITYRYIGQEVISTADFTNIATVKFSCQLPHSVKEDTPEGEVHEDFFLWFTDDANHVPVQVLAPTKIGNVKATLTSYKGLKYKENRLDGTL